MKRESVVPAPAAVCLLEQQMRIFTSPVFSYSLIFHLLGSDPSINEPLSSGMPESAVEIWNQYDRNQSCLRGGGNGEGREGVGEEEDIGEVA